MSVQLLDPLTSPAPFNDPFGPESAGFSGGFGAPAPSPGFDNIASQYPTSALGNLQTLVNDTNPMQSPASMLLGPLGGILQYLTSMISQLAGGGQQNQQYFTAANGGSNGDPHLSFNGSTWNNMNSQPDLLDSNSMSGGYRISTQTTQPSDRGITYNQCATVHTNYGQTSVALDNSGNATIMQNGYSYPLQAGTSIDLGNGETATRNANGSVAVTCANGQGGEITTTLSQNGPGIDVNTSANNVDLGGALVTGSQPAGGPPRLERYASTP